MIYLYIQNRQIYRNKIQVRGYRAEGKAEWEDVDSRYRVSVWGNEKLLEKDSSDGCIIL